MVVETTLEEQLPSEKEGIQQHFSTSVSKEKSETPVFPQGIVALTSFFLATAH